MSNRTFDHDADPGRLVYLGVGVGDLSSEYAENQRRSDVGCSPSRKVLDEDFGAIWINILRRS
jgi:hypothetical protein